VAQEGLCGLCGAAWVAGKSRPGPGDGIDQDSLSGGPRRQGPESCGAGEAAADEVP
jgi:hypothetical protein